MPLLDVQSKAKDMQRKVRDRRTAAAVDAARAAALKNFSKDKQRQVGRTTPAAAAARRANKKRRLRADRSLLQ